MARAKQIIRGILLAASLGVIAIAGYLSYQRYVGNFHVVVEGEVYRSGQITAENVADYRARYGIRSILNLRGAFPGEDWYDAEVAEAARLGITHLDFPMSASIDLGVEESERLIAVMRDMPKPLLVHCLHGADRTGLAMALYMAAIRGSDETEANGQLSLWFGHFAIPFLSDAYPMDRSWERMKPVLGFTES